MDGISRSRGWDKEIPHGVLPMEQLVLSDKWARKRLLKHFSRQEKETTFVAISALRVNLLSVSIN